MTRQGYLRVSVWHNGKMTATPVHRMVAEAFIPNPNRYPLVNHKDGIRDNNCVWNLEWVTHQMNSRHAVRTRLSAVGADSVKAKLTEAKVWQMIEALQAGECIAHVAEAFGVSAACVSHIWNGDTWKHLDFVRNTPTNYKGKLNAYDVREIRKRISAGLTDTEIAKEFGVVSASIHGIRVGKNWSKV